MVKDAKVPHRRTDTASWNR